MADKKLILLVDDDPDFVEAVRVIVENGGYEVEVAYDGKEGLEAVAERKPDLIVLDVMMPVMNVPLRLIFAYNPQRSGVLDNSFRPESAFNFRFAVGSSF